MFESVQNNLREWNKTNDDRAKLQHTYFVVSLITLVIAGLLSLINAELGQQLLFVVFMLAAIFFANAVVWALLQSFVLSRLSRRPSTRK